MLFADRTLSTNYGEIKVFSTSCKINLVAVELEVRGPKQDEEDECAYFLVSDSTTYVSKIGETTTYFERSRR